MLWERVAALQDAPDLTPEELRARAWNLLVTGSHEQALQLFLDAAAKADDPKMKADCLMLAVYTAKYFAENEALARKTMAELEQLAPESPACREARKYFASRS